MGLLQMEEIATNFCPENMVSQGAKGVKSSNKKKAIRYCCSFNDGS